MIIFLGLFFGFSAGLGLVYCWIRKTPGLLPVVSFVSGSFAGLLLSLLVSGMGPPSLPFFGAGVGGIATMEVCRVLFFRRKPARVEPGIGMSPPSRD